MRCALVLAIACGGLPQAPECEKFLACSEAVQPMGSMYTKGTYGPGGSCWQNGSDAAACAEICKQALTALQLGSGMSKAECK